MKLPSGGYLIVDQTEALVAIDVNSGKSTKEVDHEATVYKTNLEAAAEVARQLRLRDMGGIVVVDFIDMVNRRHDRDVERAVRDAMKDDKARVKIARISENGTMEITRQRLRQAHRLVSHTSCPHCNGTGIVRDPRGLAVKALRELQNRLSKEAQHLSRLTVRLPVEVANLLQNTKRRELVDLGDEHQVLIDITGDVRLQGSEIRFDGERRGKAGLDAAHGVRDPRLVGNDRGRRGGRNQRREQQGFGAGSFGGPTVPPPSIGPVPNFLDGEEAILEADARDAQEALERERLIAEGGVVEEVDERLERSRDGRPPRAPKAPDPAYPEHYDDPLTEALFGKAPADLTLADVSAAEPERAEGAEGDGQEASADGEGGRKRRRRRRKKKKPLGDAQEAAANDEGDDDEDEGDDEPAGDAKSDEPAPSAQLSAEEEAAWAAYKSDGENASASTEAPTTPPMEAASDAQSTLDAEPVSDSSIDGEVVAADEAAPKRRPGRRPRKKASDDEASAPAAALAPES